MAKASDPSSFPPCSVWCVHGYYTFVVLNERRVLCIDDGDVPTGDVGRTFPFSPILKEHAVRVA